jgi:hypothetical protein
VDESPSPEQSAEFRQLAANDCSNLLSDIDDVEREFREKGMAIVSFSFAIDPMADGEHRFVAIVLGRTIGY